MSLLKCGVLIGIFLLSIVHANASQQAIPEEVEIPEVYEKGVDIRTLSAPDIRNIHGLKADISGEVIDLKTAITDLQAEVRKEEIFIQLSADVLFDFDKSDIKPEAETELTKLAKVISEKAQGTVTIQGHTDSKGSDNYNQKLSIQRAAAIQNWLTEKGQVEAMFKLEGLGETKPVASNTTADGKDNPEGRAKNRRVEIHIQTKKI